VYNLIFQHVQKNLSAEEEKARHYPRIPRSSENKRRPQDRTRPPARRTRPAHGVIPVFSRRERLPRAAFPGALKRGRRLTSANFSIVIPEEVKGYAVVLSKKVARLSTTRQRIKRRVLSALRSLAALLPPALIVFPRPSASGVNYQDIRAELAELISKHHH
jgi:ribonuclease P protein component